jgi:hypothetical protein
MTHRQMPPAPPRGWPQPAHAPKLGANSSTRNRVIAFLAVVIVVVVAAGGALLVRHILAKPDGGELVLTAATDPGPNAFMPSAASPTPPDTQAPPTLQSKGQGGAVETQPLPGDRDGLYGGTVNNTEVDRDKIIDFLRGHPAHASAFVESLNVDNTVYWSGGRVLTVADIPRYLHELTPAFLRLDTRITNHGLDGMQRLAKQSVFEAGTAVLVDAHGVPRIHGLSGNPLTAPITLLGEPKLIGAPWAGFRPGALAEIKPSQNVTSFVLVDVVTGKPFNRPPGTTGSDDTPHTQPVAEPQPAPSTNAPPAQGHEDQSDMSGSYLRHSISWVCNGLDARSQDSPLGVAVHGNTIAVWGLSGTLNSDGSFVEDGPWGPYDHATVKGVLAMEGGHWIIRDGTWDDRFCHGVWTATKH